MTKIIKRPTPDAPHRRNKVGAPCKLTPELRQEILSAVSDGVPVTHVAAAAGICFETFCKWRRQDAEYDAAIKEAIGKGVAARLAVVKRAMNSADENTALRAACWFLEHVHPEHFARNRIELTGGNGAPLAVGIGIYLPQKDNTPLPTVSVDVKAIEDENARA